MSFVRVFGMLSFRRQFRTTSIAFLAAILFCGLHSGSGTAVDYSCVHSTSWILNTDGHTNSLFSDTLTDMKTSKISSSRWQVTTNRIPNYDHKFTKSEVLTLNARPKASSDFSSGKTTVSAGDYVVFGGDIGYEGEECEMKYWPPGPVCPTTAAKTIEFTMSPAPETRSAGQQC
jgi:hypothetical protein